MDVDGNANVEGDNDPRYRGAGRPVTYCTAIFDDSVVDAPNRSLVAGHIPAAGDNPGSVMKGRRPGQKVSSWP